MLWRFRRVGVLALAVGLAAPGVEAIPWRRAVAAGHDQVLTPGLPGHGWILFDLRGRGAVRGGDFHLQFNTETVTVALEGVRLGARVELTAALRVEALYAGILPDYIVRGDRTTARGFWASYGDAFVAVKWLIGGPHIVEGLAGGRRWRFDRRAGVTLDSLVLPEDSWVFAPRLRYTFWAARNAAREWGAEVAFPRWEGLAAGVELGLDVRDVRAPWGGVEGSPSSRNTPGAVIVMARQWLRAGRRLGPRARLGVEQNASWGRGEDDLTRPRIGGLNPFVVGLPGVPWASLLSERFVAAQAGVYVRPSEASAHEFGLAVGGGAFSDPLRTGQLGRFGGALGVMLHADLRWGRWQGYARVGWGAPVGPFEGALRLSAMLGAGASF
ncbi:MAG: hypothetical protein JNK72_24405 [Myxococcales bacterium]|nr:hypothetical protein [Myxococcales bacterium]